MMLTGLDSKFDAKLKKLGASIATTWKSCTHLVTDNIRRTTKFLCALSAGKKIVAVAWIHACVKAKKLVGE